MKCKVDSDSKAAAEKEEEEEEEAGEKIRGKRREKAAWGRRGSARERCRQDGDGVGPLLLDVLEDGVQRVDRGESRTERTEVKENEG